MLLSMHPAYAQGLTHKAAVLDLKTMNWSITDLAGGQAYSISRFGVSFETHQSKFSLTPDQLARALCGLELAYCELCSEVLSEARLFMTRTNYLNLDNFMRMLPEISVYSVDPEPRQNSQGMQVLPYLWSPEYSERMLWDGTQWRSMPFLGAPASALNTGHCFGWKVMYKDTMDVSSLCTPTDLREYFTKALDVTCVTRSDAMRFMAAMFLIAFL